MIVVDSSVWIAHYRNIDIEPVRRFRALIEVETVIMGDLILLELLQGARSEAEAGRLERGLRQFGVQSMLSADTAVQAARNYRHLRRHGITIRKSIDIVIATFCIEGGHQLLHHDRDFNPLAERLGLQVF